MDTKYLTYILTIARNKNMTKAAEELFVTQSSLSQYVSKLEQELGTPLFIRAKGELLLTPSGELYLEAAKRVLRIKDELYRNIQELANKGHVTIGVTSQFGLRLLTDVIPVYKKEYPEVDIEISELNVPALTKLLLNESIDCGIIALNSPETFSPEQVLMMRREEVYFAIPADHPYHQLNPSGSITPAELIREFWDENFILSKKGSTLRYLADRIFTQYDFQPSTMCETNSIIATRAMTAKEIGVTFIAKTCASDPANVAYYSIDPPIYRYNAFVCRKHWVQNQSERNLVRTVCEYFENSEYFD